MRSRATLRPLGYGRWGSCSGIARLWRSCIFVYFLSASLSCACVRTLSIDHLTTLSLPLAHSWLTLSYLRLLLLLLRSHSRDGLVVVCVSLALGSLSTVCEKARATSASVVRQTSTHTLPTSSLSITSARQQAPLPSLHSFHRELYVRECVSACVRVCFDLDTSSIALRTFRRVIAYDSALISLSRSRSLSRR